MTIREALKVPLHLAIRSLILGCCHAMITAGNIDQWRRERAQRRRR